jgi:hypothetical protein
MLRPSLAALPLKVSAFAIACQRKRPHRRPGLPSSVQSGSGTARRHDARIRSGPLARDSRSRRSPARPRDRNRITSTSRRQRNSASRPTPSTPTTGYGRPWKLRSRRDSASRAARRPRAISSSFARRRAMRAAIRCSRGSRHSRRISLGDHRWFDTDPPSGGEAPSVRRAPRLVHSAAPIHAAGKSA